MADIEFVTHHGVVQDTEEGSEPVTHAGVYQQQEAPAVGARPQGPLGHPLHGPLAGPIGP